VSLIRPSDFPQEFRLRKACYAHSSDGTYDKETYFLTWRHKAFIVLFRLVIATHMAKRVWASLSTDYNMVIDQENVGIDSVPI